MRNNVSQIGVNSLIPDDCSCVLQDYILKIQIRQLQIAKGAFGAERKVEHIIDEKQNSH